MHKRHKCLENRLLRTMALELAVLYQVASQTTTEATNATAIPAMEVASIFTDQASLATPFDPDAGGAGAGVGMVVAFDVAFDVALADAGVGGAGVGGVGVGGVGVGGDGV